MGVTKIVAQRRGATGPRTTCHTFLFLLGGEGSRMSEEKKTAKSAGGLAGFHLVF